MFSNVFRTLYLNPVSHARFFHILEPPLGSFSYMVSKKTCNLIIGVSFEYCSQLVQALGVFCDFCLCFLPTPVLFVPSL